MKTIDKKRKQERLAEMNFVHERQINLMLNGTPRREKDTEGSLNILTLHILKFPHKKT